jgi:hypothetical protein
MSRVNEPRAGILTTDASLDVSAIFTGIRALATARHPQMFVQPSLMILAPKGRHCKRSVRSAEETRLSTSSSPTTSGCPSTSDPKSSVEESRLTTTNSSNECRVTVMSSSNENRPSTTRSVLTKSTADESRLSTTGPTGWRTV